MSLECHYSPEQYRWAASSCVRGWTSLATLLCLVLCSCQDSAPATVTANGAPLAVDDEATTPEDVSLSISVLANDSDVDGHVLTIQNIGSAEHGTTQQDQTAITYVPATDFHGSDSFSYTISDGHGAFAQAKVLITIEPENDPPVATNDSASTDQVTAVSIEVLANDTDVDGDQLVIQQLSTPEHGAVAHDGTVVTYTPALDFAGSDTFSYTAADPSGGTATALVSVTVSAVWQVFGPGEGGGVVDNLFSRSNADRAWVLTDCGGVHQSDDGAESWGSINGTATGAPLVVKKQIGQNIDLQLHPTSEQIIFVSDARGRLHRSQDGGQSWATVLEIPDKEYGLSVIAFDPSQPETIYVGTGKIWDKRGFFNPKELPCAPTEPGCQYYAPGHVHKSTNSGDIWTELTTAFPVGESVYSLIVDPDDSNLIWATTNKSIYQSTNAGASFGPLMNGIPADAWIGRLRLDESSSVTSRTLYVLVVNPGGVYKTTNGGATWTAVNYNFHSTTEESQQSHFFDLEIDPTDPDTLYLTDTQRQVPGADLGRVFKSTDGGGNWTEIFQAAVGASTSEPSRFVDDGWAADGNRHPTNLAIASDSSQLLLHIDSPSRHFASTDGGHSWQQRYAVTIGDDPIKASRGRGREVIGNPRVAVRSRDNPDYFYIGYGDHGAFWSEDGGRSFYQLPYQDDAKLLKTHDIAAIALDPVNANIVYLGTGRTGDEARAGIAMVQIDRPNHEASFVILGGGSGLANKMPSGMVDDIVVLSSNDIYLRWSLESTGETRLYHFDGSEWAEDEIAGAQIRKLVFNETGGGTLYVATDQGVYQKSPAGGQWQQLSGANAPSAVVFVAVPPVTSPLLYAVDGAAAELWQYDGTEWSQLTPGPPEPLEEIAVDALDPAVVVGSRLEGGIYRFDGSAWQSVSLNLPSPSNTGLRADQLYGGTYYVGQKCLGYWKLSL